MHIYLVRAFTGAEVLAAFSTLELAQAEVAKRAKQLGAPAPKWTNPYGCTYVWNGGSIMGEVEVVKLQMDVLPYA